MAGLAIGNVVSTRLARANPIRTYAMLEFTIAGSGLLLVLILPFLSRIPLFRVFVDSPMLNPARLIVAFVLLAIPSTVMGATLPTMVGALSRSDANFGRVLGLLYGCNTMGAVVGALAGELLLIKVFGVRGTGLVAALCSVTAGLAALRLSGGPASVGQTRPTKVAPPRLLAAACLAGFALLALEVIWFRFVILFAMSTSVTFAVMLAVVLAGIGFGALVASAALSRRIDADRYTPVIAAASVVAVIVSYSGFVAQPKGQLLAVIVDSLRLMLPVSVLSGVLFTAIGRSVERATGDEIAAAAMTTFANTVGAACGPLIAGFVMLPAIGIERSFFAIAVVYLVVAVLTIRVSAPRNAVVTAGAIAIAALVFFPFGLFRSEFLPFATRVFREGHVVAVSEGPIETAVYLRTDYAGEPYIYRLFTNGYSMSATTFASKRYMSTFVFLPLALRPHAQNALLISYGVGITAKTLANAQQLRSIDIVDISRNILSLSGIVWPGRSNPTLDPRAHVHVEDGRFFLLATKKRFDLITAEPPPPKSAGVVNLYTREHFALMRDRLSDDGIASYWLPAYQLNEADNLAVIRAFCDVFADCSMWSGAGAEWILVGSRGTRRPPTSAEFAAQWNEPANGEWLRRVGFEHPAQLAATFIADAPMLRAMTQNAKPVTDDFPLRLSPDPVPEVPAFILPLMDAAPRTFQRSAFVKAILPDDIRAAAMPLFAYERLFDRVLMIPLGSSLPPPKLVRAVLTSSDLRTLPRFLFSSDAWLEDLVARARSRGDRDPRLAYVLGVGALSDRDYARASALFAEAARGMPGNRELRDYRMLADTLSR